MESTFESSSKNLECESNPSTPDTDFPDLLEDMDNIRLNSSNSSSESSPVAEPISRRRSSRASTSAASERLEKKLHIIKSRAIAKPRRLDPSTLAPDVSETIIKKLYTNKKMNKLKPTNLETIFEEPKEDRKHGLMFLSAQKYRRMIQFKDHKHINKQTVVTRRKRIKRLLGSAPKLKKLNMDQFMAHLQNLQKEANEDVIEQ